MIKKHGSMLAFRDAGPSVLPGGDQTATANILEELLIALMGHTGDIFVDVSASGRGKIADPGACSFTTAKDLRFISAPDRCTLPDSSVLWEDLCILLYSSLKEECALQTCTDRP